MMFVLPSLVLGYFSSYAALYYIFDWMFQGNASEYDVTFIPDIQATIFSLSLGLFIPLISAIIPIRLALRNTLSESLNTKRSLLSGTKITIDDQNSYNTAMLVPGFTIIIFGAVVFYLLPYSLLHVDLGLLLMIFLSLLFGMILGAVLIAFNFERFFEVALAEILLFWENKSIKILVLKNLIVHKHRNELTAII